MLSLRGHGSTLFTLSSETVSFTSYITSPLSSFALLLPLDFRQSSDTKKKKILFQNTASMASPAIHQAITEAASKYRFPEGRVFEYGTAGVSYACSSFYPLSFANWRFLVPHESVSTPRRFYIIIPQRMHLPS